VCCAQPFGAALLAALNVSSGRTPVSLMQAMFTTTTPTTFGTVQTETPLPSPLRFEVETYDQLHVITHPDPGYCFVDANNP
jgi:hypothetical protein